MSELPTEIVTLRTRINERIAQNQPFEMHEVVNALTSVCVELLELHTHDQKIFVYADAISEQANGLFKLLLERTGTKPTQLPDSASLAPELHENDAPTNAATSVFSVGAIAYEMLTLKPYRSGMPLPSVLHSHLPHVVDMVLAKALEKNPTTRPTDLKAFTEALRLADNAVSIVPISVEEQLPEIELEMRVSILLMPPSSSPSPVESTTPVSNRAVEELSALKARLEKDQIPRWMVVKNNMDHGPFVALELLLQIASDTFTLEDLLVNTDTQERMPIKKHPEFSRFAHHAELKREGVREQHAVALAERREKKAGVAKSTIGLAALVAVVASTAIVVWKIRGRSDDERRRKGDDSMTIAAEGNVSAQAATQNKARLALGRGSGAQGAGPTVAYGGVRSFEEARSSTVSDIEAETLSIKDCDGPISGSIALDCGLSGFARAQYYVKNGRVIGATVSTNPSQPEVNACMASRIASLSFRNVDGASGCTKTFNVKSQ